MRAAGCRVDADYGCCLWVGSFRKSFESVVLGWKTVVFALSSLVAGHQDDRCIRTGDQTLGLLHRHRYGQNPDRDTECTEVNLGPAASHVLGQLSR